MVSWPSTLNLVKKTRCRNKTWSWHLKGIRTHMGPNIKSPTAQIYIVWTTSPSIHSVSCIAVKWNGKRPDKAVQYQSKLKIMELSAASGRSNWYKRFICSSCLRRCLYVWRGTSEEFSQLDSITISDRNTDLLLAHFPPPLGMFAGLLWSFAGRVQTVGWKGHFYFFKRFITFIFCSIKIK